MEHLFMPGEVPNLERVIWVLSWIQIPTLPGISSVTFPSYSASLSATVVFWIAVVLVYAP